MKKLFDESGEQHNWYEIKWQGTTQAADEELGTALTSAKVGTTTPFQVTVVSTDVGDDRGNTAGFVHSVALIGLSVSSAAAYTAGETPKTTVEVIAMDGTTDVLSTRYYVWLDHIYACEWGTGATHDAEGNITAESPANTTLITLAATFNEGEGGTWHFQEGSILTTELVRTTPTATLAAGDGVVVMATYKFFNHDLDDENLSDLFIRYPYIHYGSEIHTREKDMVPRYVNTDKATCRWSEADTANTPVIDIQILQQATRVPLTEIN